MLTTLRVHDVLGPIPAGRVIANDSAEQPVVDECLADAPFVVVRRQVLQEGRIAVGVRGKSRSARYAGWLETWKDLPAFAPEDLRTGKGDSPAFASLCELHVRWRELELPWGPTGSVGFSLASGVMAAHAGSDLDVMIRADRPLSMDRAQALLQETQGLPAKVDVLIETPSGAVALSEWARGAKPVLLRRAGGVELVDDPWERTLTV